MNYDVIYQTHKISVLLFLLLYVVKTILLLTGKIEALQKITKAVKVPEMIISTLFLVTGIYMLTQIPEIKPLLIVKIIVVLASIPIAIIGFKKQNKALASISLIMIIAAYGMAEMSKKAKGSKAENNNIADASSLYKTNCSSCHGDDGKLGLTGATDLSTSALDNAGIIHVIANGRGAMAPFKGALSDEQVQAVAGYVESLKK